MLNSLINTLSHIGWRKKILGYSALYVILVLVVGLFGVYTINEQKQSMENIVQGSQTRVNVAANARVVVVEMGRALANVVVAEERREIRRQVVAVIRSLSLFDELT